MRFANSFPHAIFLQPDDSGKHLWAEFGGAEEALRVSLLYAHRGREARGG